MYEPEIRHLNDDGSVTIHDQGCTMVIKSESLADELLERMDDKQFNLNLLNWIVDGEENERYFV